MVIAKCRHQPCVDQQIHSPMVGLARMFGCFIRNRIKPIDDLCLQLAEPQGTDVLFRDLEFAFGGLAEDIHERRLDVHRAILRQPHIQLIATRSIRMTDDRDVDCWTAERRRQLIGTYDSQKLTPRRSQERVAEAEMRRRV